MRGIVFNTIGSRPSTRLASARVPARISAPLL
jgi:hypothetical protein